MANVESRERRTQLVRGLAISLIAWLAIATLHLAGAFHSFEFRLLDWRFRLRGERVAPDAIALVGVDDATVRGYGAWPIPRDAYALLLNALSQGGARAIGVDLQFPEDANQDPRWNQLLAQVTGARENVVQPVWFQSEGAATVAAGPRATEVESAFARHGVTAGNLDIITAGSVSLPFDDLVLNSPSLGHISVAVDPDGAIRRVPFVIKYGGRAFPALTLCMAGLSRGEGQIHSIRAVPGGLRVRWTHGYEVRIPTDGTGASHLDYAGDDNAFPNLYSMLEILQWYRAGDLRRIREAVAGRLVLVGLTAREEVSEDVGTTPFSTSTPMLFVHANALENLMRGRFLTRIPNAYYLGLLALLSVALGSLYGTLSIPAAALLALGSMIAIAGLDFALLAKWAIDVPPLAALALPPLVHAATGGYRHLFLQRRSLQRETDIREGLTVQQRFLPEALVGKTLSHYVIEAKLGGGGMGVVYRGRDQRLARDVAIKVLSGGVLADEALRRRFRREALALSRFSHPAAAALFDFDSQDGVDFIVMEYVPGVSLAERLRRGPLPEREAIGIAASITGALAAAHERGIIHRDIKPANVILTPPGEAKLLDFGVAQLSFASEGSTVLGRTLTQTGEIVGTPAYLAPELIQGENAGVGTDIYGVGMLLFEMTTGHRPFPDDRAQELMYVIMNQPPPRPRLLNARLTTSVEDIILRALEKRPEERFESAHALLAALRSAG